MTKTTIVPFGKYKGQPVEVLAQDEAYLEWLTAQDWFRNKYQNLYTIIINNFHAPSETPEQNLLQAKFLDEEYSFKIAYLLASYTSPSEERKNLDFETEVKFEEEGMDVLLATTYYSFKKSVDVFIEIKPILSDDYPAVLRQITSTGAYKRYRNKNFNRGDEKIYGMIFCLLVDSYSGSISKSELESIFLTSDICVLFTDKIDSIELEFSEEKDDWVEKPVSS